MYILSKNQEAMCLLVKKRISLGLGATLLLEGPPGSGKTSFVKELARQLSGKLYPYFCAPDKERNLLYDPDIKGIIRRETAWVPGPCWEAFIASNNGSVVLLIDEVDKASPGFDAFLLWILEEYSFRSPEGETIKANHGNTVVCLTTNGRRELRPEVLRRCQRISFKSPNIERMKEIILSIISGTYQVPGGLLDVICRIGIAIRQISEERAPSPKELANLLIDLLTLKESGVMDAAIVKEVAASWLFKSPADLESFHPGYRWARAIQKELEK